jgi:hypothetical protein
MKPRHFIPALAGALALYFFSIGPAMGLAYRYPETLFMPVHTVYRPLIELAIHFDPYRSFLNWYIGPWMPKRKSN